MSSRGLPTRSAHDTQDARQSAIDTAQSILDLQLCYRPPTEIDMARFDLWLAQLIVDAGRERGQRRLLYP